MSERASFDPNAPAGKDAGVFGLPFTEEESALVYLPVPWEATTSYGGGTSEGPRAILEASKQVDLYDLDVEKPYAAGLCMLQESEEVRAWNGAAKELAQEVIEGWGERPAEELEALAQKVTVFSRKVNDYVEAETGRLLDAGKIPAIVGGDHAVPLGALRAVGSRASSFGVLHFDAHADLRDAYEGFQYSHASILRNVLDEVPAVTKLVQVGIRDVCEQEIDFATEQGDRVVIFDDRTIQRSKAHGESFASLADRIVAELPERLWVTFDIDGLDPRYCPHTGTPVPGGLDFSEAVHILRSVVLAGKTIIGFDLNEVAPNLSDENDEWDANVGARLLYKLTGFCLASRGLATLRP
jgi:agmatinase